jgi:phage terminase large subunit-like protein
MAQKVKTVYINFVPWEREQADLIRSLARLKCAVAGARGGKTKAGAAQLAINAITQPGYRIEDLQRGEPYTIVVGARDYPQIRRVILPEIKLVIPKDLQIGPYHETKHMLRVRGIKYGTAGNGTGETHIYFLSGKEPESWQGQKLYGVWLDEAASIKEELYLESLTRLSDRQGWMVLTTTPKGPNWLYQRVYKPWLDGDPSSKGVYFTTWPTSKNPHFPKEELERNRKMMPERYFNRMFYATWDAYEGQVYEDFMQEVHVVERNRFTFVLPSKRTVGRGKARISFTDVVAGVDWGYGQGHPCVILVCGITKDGTWYVVKELSEENLETVAPAQQDCWVKRALALRTDWEISAFYCDTESPQNIHHFRQAKLNAIEAKKDIIPGIQDVATLMKIEDKDRETQNTHFHIVKSAMDERDASLLIAQIFSYHWFEGNKETPVQENCDACDALRYAIYTHKKIQRFQRKTGGSIIGSIHGGRL